MKKLTLEESLSGMAKIVGADATVALVEQMKEICDQALEIMEQEKLSEEGKKALKKLLVEQYLAGMDATKAFYKKQEEKKSEKGEAKSGDKSYTIVVDVELDEIINYMDTAAQMNPAFIHTIEHKGLSGRYKKFLDEWSDKNHAMGWCKDPSCSRKNG